jgi:hypothetical protein
VLPIAVGESDGPLTFHFQDGHSDIATARDLGDEQRPYRRLSVECRRLDSLLGDVLRDRVGVMKIDVEGFELQVVRGARELIRRDRPAIVFEYWPEVAGPLGWRVEDVAEAITAAGGPYIFEAYQQDRRVEYPPRRVEDIYNIVALPRRA